MHPNLPAAGRLALVTLVTLMASAGLTPRQSFGQASGAADPPPAPEQSAGSGGESPQHATADDMHVFDPYIGRFRSKTFEDEESGKTFHHVVEYRWFDALRSVVEFTVSTVVGEDAERVNSRGFYGYDPFHEQLYVIAALTQGGSGFGTVGEFDRATRRRVTWARSRTPDGRTMHVRDAFEVVDENSWKDVTSVREGEEGEWRVVYRDTFTRIAD